MANDVKHATTGAVQEKPFYGLMQIGQRIDGKGVFIGVREVRDKQAYSLGIFNVFAAPYDLGLDENGQGRKILGTFNNAAEKVAEIRGLMGHDGGDYDSAEAAEDSLREGRYRGEWFIPWRDILLRNMYENKNKGELKGTFVDVVGAPGGTRWYWSSSRLPRFFDGPLPIAAISFTDGSGREAYASAELDMQVPSLNCRAG